MSCSCSPRIAPRARPTPASPPLQPTAASGTSILLRAYLASVRVPPALDAAALDRMRPAPPRAPLRLHDDRAFTWPAAWRALVHRVLRRPRPDPTRPAALGVVRGDAA